MDQMQIGVRAWRIPDPQVPEIPPIDPEPAPAPPTPQPGQPQN